MGTTLMNHKKRTTLMFSNSVGEAKDCAGQFFIVQLVYEYLCPVSLVSLHDFSTVYYFLYQNHLFLQKNRKHPGEENHFFKILQEYG